MDAVVREARRDDVPRIVELLADDDLGRGREEIGPPLPQVYWAAFEALDADPRHLLLVAESDGTVVGTLQLSLIPGLSRRGAERGQIEAVRVAGDARGTGVGGLLVGHAIELARARGCRLVQLTTDARRADAHRFYSRLGFAPSHVGMKLDLRG